MKTSTLKTFVGSALAILALAGASTGFAASDFVVSTFDSDLGSNPYGTNLWSDSAATSVTWTNYGNPAGSLDLVSDWALGTPGGGAYQWEENQLTVRPWGNSTNDDRGLDMRFYQSLEFDVFMKSSASQTNLHGDFGGINVALQGDPYWGINDSNGVPWTGLATASFNATNSGWVHFSLPTQPFQGTLSQIIFQRFDWGNSNNTMHTEELIDNVKLIAASGPPPTLHYTKAVHGLNMWTTAGVSDRNNIATYQDGTYFYMWSDFGAASYSFTISSFPSDPAHTNMTVRLYLVPTTTTDNAPDWNQANCIFCELGVDINGIATWEFHWKTNAPADNGNLYQASAQIILTNPTPVGKWTLAFGGNPYTSVTMTSPNGNSTNFVMGVHPNVPDIHESFSGNGLVYLGLFTGATNAGDLDVTFAGAQLGGDINTISNNWAADTNLNSADPFAGPQPQWVTVGTPPYYLVPTNNATWVTWNLPDGGFFLQTNTANVGSPLNWSTNHGLPPGSIIALHKAVLVKPGDLPNTPKLLFRLSRPGY